SRPPHRRAGFKVRRALVLQAPQGVVFAIDIHPATIKTDCGGAQYTPQTIQVVNAPATARYTLELVVFGTRRALDGDTDIGSTGGNIGPRPGTTGIGAQILNTHFVVIHVGGEVVGILDFGRCARCRVARRHTGRVIQVIQGGGDIA